MHCLHLLQVIEGVNSLLAAPLVKFKQKDKVEVFQDELTMSIVYTKVANLSNILSEAGSS